MAQGNAESYRDEITSWGSHEVTGGRKRKGTGQAANLNEQETLCSDDKQTG